MYRWSLQAYGSEKFQYAHLNSLVSFNCRNINSIWSDRSHLQNGDMNIMYSQHTETKLKVKETGFGRRMSVDGV